MALRNTRLDAAAVVALVGLMCASLVDARSEHSVLELTSPPEGHRGKICSQYYSEFKELPQGPDAADELFLIDFTGQSTCDKAQAINIKNKIVLVQDTHNCTLEKVMQLLKDAGAYGLIVALAGTSVAHIQVDEDSSPVRDLALGFAANSTAMDIKLVMTTNEPLAVKWYTKDMDLDLALLVTLFLAVFSVAAGGYSSGNHKLEAYEEELERKRLRRQGLRSRSRRMSLNRMQEEMSTHITSSWVFCFVFFMGFMLVVLYFLIKYLVYFAHGMFALASGSAVVGVMEQLVYMMPCGTSRLPSGAVPCCHGSLEVRQLLVIIVGFIVPAIWVYIRHDEYSWVLQDSLGVLFSVYILRIMRMPSMKICTLLLWLLFFYDIFFVFLTPFFLPGKMTHNASISLVNSTSRGDSIMVEVATGGGSKEQIPMLMRVPRFGNQELNACLSKYQLLGFGDILIPGLLVAFLRGFDLINVGGCLYFPLSVICYALGLIATFAGLYLMRMSQPALLYLVPFTVLPVLCLAWCRGELHDMWHGLAPEDPAQERDGEVHSVSQESKAEDSASPTGDSSPPAEPSALHRGRYQQAGIQPAEFQPTGPQPIGPMGYQPMGYQPSGHKFTGFPTGY